MLNTLPFEQEQNQKLKQKEAQPLKWGPPPTPAQPPAPPTIDGALVKLYLVRGIVNALHYICQLSETKTTSRDDFPHYPRDPLAPHPCILGFPAFLTAPTHARCISITACLSYTFPNSSYCCRCLLLQLLCSGGIHLSPVCCVPFCFCTRTWTHSHTHEPPLTHARLTDRRNFSAFVCPCACFLVALAWPVCLLTYYDPWLFCADKYMLFLFPHCRTLSIHMPHSLHLDRLPILILILIRIRVWFCCSFWYCCLDSQGAWLDTGQVLLN